MRALITGAEGQDGHYLTASLVSRGYDVVGTALLPEDGSHQQLDVTDADAVREVINRYVPDVVFHLAALSSVAIAEQQPDLAHAVNVGGVAHVLAAVVDIVPKCLLVNAASVEVFAVTSSVIDERSPLGGGNVYARTKQQALELVRDARASGVRATNAILSNHESAFRGPQFVMGKIGRGVAAISRGEQDSITMGNLDVERDWSFAGDICEGMAAVADAQFVGDVILASGTTVRLSEIVAAAFRAVGIDDWQAHVHTDPALVRTEGQVRRFDVTRAATELGWHASTPVDAWVGDLVRAFL